jgi:hypothetical protein
MSRLTKRQRVLRASPWTAENRERRAFEDLAETFGIPKLTPGVMRHIRAQIIEGAVSSLMDGEVIERGFLCGQFRLRFTVEDVNSKERTKEFLAGLTFAKKLRT